jgi:hypothetical protein
MRLIDLPAGENRDLVLSQGALEAFEQFRQLIHAGKAALDGREREWWVKGPMHVLRLAGTLAYLEWAMRGSQPLPYASKNDETFRQLLQNAKEPTELSAELMAGTVQLWRTYFWPHARAALRQVGLSERHKDSRHILRWLRSSDKTQVSREEVRREGLGRRLDADQTQILLDGLTKAGWMRKVTIPTGGRPAYRWEVNPRLFGR